MVGLVHGAWEKSFAKKHSNKQAIAEQGWNPLNYNLLAHEELCREKDSTLIQNAYELSSINGVIVPDANDINLSDVIAKTVMDKIVDFWIREKALDTARKTQEEACINERQLIFNIGTKMTAVIAFSAGNVCLSDGKIHEKVRERSTTTDSKKYEMRKGKGKRDLRNFNQR